MRPAGRGGRGGAGYLRRGTIRVDITTRLSCDTAAAGGGLSGDCGDGVLAAWAAWAARAAQWEGSYCEAVELQVRSPF